MRSIILLVFLMLFTLTISAQDKFHWKKLSFETSTVQDVITVLGKPKKDAIEKVEYDKSVPANVKKEFNLRKLEYQNVDNFKKVFLLFNNDKLFSIQLVSKNKSVLASELLEIYESEFLFAEGLPKTINFKDFYGQNETSIPKVYPANYFMLSAKKDVGIVATVNNNNWKAIWRDGIKKPTNEMFPGYVDSIMIITRAFEQK